MRVVEIRFPSMAFQVARMLSMNPLLSECTPPRGMGEIIGEGRSFLRRYYYTKLRITKNNSAKSQFRAFQKKLSETKS